jgi:DNA-binding transcriptional regulator LsrR (DeoR family)
VQDLQAILPQSLPLKEMMVVMEMVMNQDQLEEVVAEAVAQVLVELLQLHHRMVMVEMV